MGGLLVVLFGVVFVAVVIYALVLEWCDRTERFTAHEYIVDRVIVGEALVVGLPTVFYLLLHFFWSGYAEVWEGPWAAAREVVAVYVICQIIGGMVMWGWQRWKHQRFYYEEDE